MHTKFGITTKVKRHLTKPCWANLEECVSLFQLRQQFHQLFEMAGAANQRELFRK